jgi:hypothetical protein
MVHNHSSHLAAYNGIFLNIELVALQIIHAMWYRENRKSAQELKDVM